MSKTGEPLNKEHVETDLVDNKNFVEDLIKSHRWGLKE